MPLYRFEDRDWSVEHLVQARCDSEALSMAREWATEWVDNSIREDAGHSGQSIACVVSVYRLDVDYELEELDGEVIELPEGELVDVVAELVRPLYRACGGGVAEDPEDDHDWRQVSAVGHGGGVRVHYDCTRCGAHRVRDTWAPNGRGGHCLSDRVFVD